MVDFKKLNDKMKGKYDKFLALDVETSAINYNSINPAEGCQIVSIGLLVVSFPEFKILDELYIEIKFDPKYKWDNRAFDIHKLSKEYLEENGFTEAEAVEAIGLFLDQHFGIDNEITVGGVNTNFDICFIKTLLNRNDLTFKFSHRVIDTNSLGVLLYDSFKSNILFETLGIERSTDVHNALEDAKLAVKVFKITYNLWQKVINE